MASGKPADSYLCKEYWLELLTPVERVGRLDNVKPIIATTPKEKDIAKKQNYALTRHSYGMPSGYERIKWKSQH